MGSFHRRPHLRSRPASATPSQWTSVWYREQLATAQTGSRWSTATGLLLFRHHFVGMHLLPMIDIVEDASVRSVADFPSACGVQPLLGRPLFESSWFSAWRSCPP